MVADAERPHVGVSTPGQEQARATITKTTITPAPGTEPAGDDAPNEKPSLRERLLRGEHGELTAALKPFEGSSIVRFIMSALLSVLCLLTVGGAILLLLLWQQDRSSGVLTSQVDRTWELFDLLREIERWVAFAVIPVATAWIALATVNVRRATGNLRNPVIAAGSLPAGLLGVWVVGREIVATSDEWLGQTSGYVLQVIPLAFVLLIMERVTDAAEARHRPLRAAFVISVVFLAHLQFLGGLSTIDQTSGADEWGPLGAYLIIGALLQALGSLSVNEAARSIEEGTDNRYRLRERFGESLLAQAAARL
jgi:hypothetical protein